MSDQGKANYEGYRAAAMGKSLVSGAPLPEWDELSYQIKLAWDAGACSVELWLAECPVDEDAEPKRDAKVIVVTDGTGRDRRYAADEWQAEEAIDVLRAGEVIATYPQGTWRRATVEGAQLDAVTPKAIRFQSALRQIATAEHRTAIETLRGLAADALKRDGWDEEDL